MPAAAGTYTPTFIEPPFVWSRQTFAEPDVTEPIQPYPAATAPVANAKAVSGRTQKVTDPSVVYIDRDRERVKARFRLLRRLPADHDNEGAAAAQQDSVDAAIAFIDQMRDYPAPFYATLDDDGSAVIEFEDRVTGFFADVTFRGRRDVICYVRRMNRPLKILLGIVYCREIVVFMV
jgi:hypothetical protein